MLMEGGEHDEAILIYALQMRARRLLRRHCLPLTMTPRNDNSEVLQQPLWVHTQMYSRTVIPLLSPAIVVDSHHGDLLCFGLSSGRT